MACGIHCLCIFSLGFYLLILGRTARFHFLPLLRGFPPLTLRVLLQFPETSHPDESREGPHSRPHQAPLFMGFSRQEYWRMRSCAPPGDLPDPGVRNLISHISCTGRQVLYHKHHQGSPMNSNVCLLIPNSQFIPLPLSLLVTTSLFSKSVSLFGK